MIIGLSLVWSWWKQAWYRPIEVVSLADKLQYAEPVLVKNAVADEVKLGFFGMHIGVMRDRLLEVPWIVGAQVQRKWPKTVLLKVQERQPLAIWEGAATKGVIDTTGKLFYPPQADFAKLSAKQLPEFVGQETRLSAMVEMYLQILAKIKPLGLAVKKLQIMPDNGWQAMLDNEMLLVLGQQEVEERLSRFVLAYKDQKVGLRDGRVHVVDLRYTNGFATNG